MGQYEVVPTDFGFTFEYEAEEPGELHSEEGQIVTCECFVWVPFGIHLKKTVPSGGETVITMFCSPTSADRTELFLFPSRNYDLDGDDQPYVDFTHTIMEVDRRIVESQRPVALPVDLTEELHLRGSDAGAIAYRRSMAEFARAAAS
jgi:phenylpropionate dioxygenase-like ring-hydroxylating dioxygenase large terminal subunit